MLIIVDSAVEEIRRHVEHYAAQLGIPLDRLAVTTERQVFKSWRGRLPSSRCAGCYSPPPRKTARHVIYLNLGKCLDLEVVIAEECLHMRDWLHAEATGTKMRVHRKHGYDPIAHEVAALTGRTIEAVRGAIRGPQRRSYRYIYACPTCGLEIHRRRAGRWSCGRCDKRFNPAHLLILKTTLEERAGD